MQSTITVVDLLRHGEVQGKACYRGITDDPLTIHGRQQMQHSVAEYSNWNTIISSPLRRCSDFANQLSQQKNTPLLIDKGFQEINFGEWEGKTAEQIQQTDSEGFRRFYEADFNYAPPKGESLQMFQQRVNAVWLQLLREQRGKNVLLVTHAGVIRILFCLLLQLPLEKCFAIQVDYAGLSRFRCFHTEDHDFIQLDFHNRTGGNKLLPP